MRSELKFALKFAYIEIMLYLCSRIQKKQMNMKAPEIKFDPRNYRKHSEQNKKVIKKSLQELGAGRSVVIDADDTLVAGNGVYEQAQKLKMPVRVVETDGSELVVVKRTDIHADDEKRRKLALADNAAGDLSEWNDDLLRADWAQGGCGGKIRIGAMTAAAKIIGQMHSNAK